MKNSFKNTFLLAGKTASIDRDIQKIKGNGWTEKYVSTNWDEGLYFQKIYDTMEENLFRK